MPSELRKLRADEEASAAAAAMFSVAKHPPW
jgi:hypothetical protein